MQIQLGNSADLISIFEIYKRSKNKLEEEGIYQWTENYPNISIVEQDLKEGVLYVLKDGKEIVSAINISEKQEPEYKQINWEFDDSKVLVIHRLVIDSKHQRKGYARQLMDFAENYAKENKYSSIRLDAYSAHKRVIEFYKKRNYFIRGEVNFTERKNVFYCMEKEIV